MVLDYKQQYDPDFPFASRLTDEGIVDVTFERRQVFQFHGLKLKAFRLFQEVIKDGLETLLMHAEKHLDSTAERRGKEIFRAYYSENRDQTGAVEVVNERLSLTLSRRTHLRNLKRFKENCIGHAAEDLIAERYKEDPVWRISGQGVPDFVVPCIVRSDKGVPIEESPTQHPQIWEVKCRDFDDKHSPQWWLEHKLKYAPPFFARGIELILLLVFYTQGSLILEKWIIVNPEGRPDSIEGWTKACALIEQLPKAE